MKDARGMQNKIATAALAVIAIAASLSLPQETTAQVSTLSGPKVAYANPFNEITGDQVDSGVLPNIGQTQHRFTALFDDAPSQTCPAHTADIAFEASFDNSEYFRVGQPIQLVGTNLAANMETNGAWPYLRVQVNDFDTTNCVMTGWYTGETSPIKTHPVQDPGYNGGMRTQTVGFTTAGSGVDTTIAAAPTGFENCLYGGLLSSDSAVEVRLKDEATDNTTGTVIGPISLAANGATNMSPSLYPWSCFGTANPVAIRVDAAAEIGGVLIFRQEAGQGWESSTPSPTPVEFTAVGSDAGSGVSSLSYSFTCPSGSNLLLFGIGMNQPDTVSTVEYKSTGATQVLSRTCEGTTQCLATYQISGATAVSLCDGTSGTVEVTMGGSSQVHSAVMSFSGHGSIVSSDTDGATTGTSATLTVSASSDSLAADFCTNEGEQASANPGESGQTERFDMSGGPDDFWGSTRRGVGGTTRMSWTWTLSDDWVCRALALSP